ncbi:MAG TPA: SBBP repeat-containing protein [Chloroflexota bacterium]|nr:SBBP repeat-containing protein [Chloroflexota bacterium]
MPLHFEQNRGQTDSRVAYLAHGPGYTVYLTVNEAVLSVYPPASPNQGAPLSPDGSSLSGSGPALPSLAATAPITPSAVLHLSLRGANPQAAPVGQARLAGEVNYLYGNDPSGWLTHIPTFAEVRYPNVYPGIDLVYHGRQQQLEYDFKLQPGADPNLVRLQVAGAQSVALDGNGNLALQAGGATLVQAQPTVYQEISGRRVPVDAHYTLLGGGQVGFTLGSYDRGQPLVIDPVLEYSTYLGGTGTDFAEGIAVDAAGSAYITGFSNSANFPVAGGLPY